MISPTKTMMKRKERWCLVSCIVIVSVLLVVVVVVVVNVIHCNIKFS